MYSTVTEAGRVWEAKGTVLCTVTEAGREWEASAYCFSDRDSAHALDED